MSPSLQVDALPTEPPGKPFIRYVYLEYFSHSVVRLFTFLQVTFDEQKFLIESNLPILPLPLHLELLVSLPIFYMKMFSCIFLWNFYCFYLSYFYLELSFVDCKVTSQNTLFLPMEISNCPNNMHLIDQSFSTSLFSHLSKPDDIWDAISGFFILFHWPIFVSPHTITT